MDPKKTIPITEARKRIFEIIDEVQKPDTYYTLTEKGRPKAVILSYEYFDDLLDDLEIYSDPKLLKDIQEAEQEYKKGEYVSWEELKKELGFDRHEALAVHDKGKEKYQVKRNVRKRKRGT